MKVLLIATTLGESFGSVLILQGRLSVGAPDWAETWAPTEGRPLQFRYSNESLTHVTAHASLGHLHHSQSAPTEMLLVSRPGQTVFQCYRMRFHEWKICLLALANLKENVARQTP